jgi:hypothetical protein
VFDELSDDLRVVVSMVQTETVNVEDSDQNEQDDYVPIASETTS